MSARNIPTTKAQAVIPADRRKNSERLTTILVAPHVSEKAGQTGRTHLLLGLGQGQAARQLL